MDSIIGLGIFLTSCYLSIVQADQILRHHGFVNNLKGEIPPSIWLVLPFFVLYSGTGYTLYKLYKNK